MKERRHGHGCRMMIIMDHIFRTKIERKYKKSDRKRLKKERKKDEGRSRKRPRAVRKAERYGKRAVAEAEIPGISLRTIYRWIKRYREHVKEGLRDKKQKTAQ